MRGEKLSVMNIKRFKDGIKIEEKKADYVSTLKGYELAYEKLYTFLLKKVYVELNIADKQFKGMLSINLLSLVLDLEPFTIYRTITRKLKDNGFIKILSKYRDDLYVTISYIDNNNQPKEIAMDILRYYEEGNYE